MTWEMAPTDPPRRISRIRVSAIFALVCGLEAVIACAVRGVTGTSGPGVPLDVSAGAYLAIALGVITFVAILVGAIVRGRDNVVAVVLVVLAVAGAVGGLRQGHTIATGGAHVARALGWSARDCRRDVGFHWGHYCQPSTI